MRESLAFSVFVRSERRLSPITLENIMLIFLVILTVYHAYGQTFTLSIPGEVPTNAARVDPSFPAFAFELASFFPYTTHANGTANKLTQNLINAVATRTGTKPVVRVGGTSGDHATLQKNLSEPTEPEISPTERPAFNDLIVGDSFFGSFQNIPNAQYIVNIPLGKRDDANAMAFAKSYWNTVGTNNMQAIQVGNEPDLYDPRPSKQE